MPQPHAPDRILRVVSGRRQLSRRASCAAIGTETVGSIVCPAAPAASSALSRPTTSSAATGSSPSPSLDTPGPHPLRARRSYGALRHRRASLNLLEGLRPSPQKAPASASVGPTSASTTARPLIESQLSVLAGWVPPWSTRPGPRLDDSEQRQPAHRLRIKRPERLPGPLPQCSVRTLSDVIAFNLAHAQAERLDFFGQESMIQSNACGPLSEPAIDARWRRPRPAGRDAFNRPSASTASMPSCRPPRPRLVIDAWTGTTSWGSARPRPSPAIPTSPSGRRHPRLADGSRLSPCCWQEPLAPGTSS